MGIPTHKTTHQAEAIAQLLSVVQDTDLQLVEQVNLLAAIVQSCEDLNWDCLVNRYLTTAVGVQLDAYGKVLGYPRAGSGLLDADYRRILHAWQCALRSQGRGDWILRAMYSAAGATDAEINRIGEATIQVDCYVPTPPLSAELNAALLVVMGAAVASGVQYLLTVCEDDHPFRFDDPPGDGFDDGLLVERLI